MAKWNVTLAGGSKPVKLEADRVAADSQDNLVAFRKDDASLGAEEIVAIFSYREWASVTQIDSVATGPYNA